MARRGEAAAAGEGGGEAQEKATKRRDWSERERCTARLAS
jgi:hypothetical protein